MPSEKIKVFQKTIWEYYKNNKREFPWRNIDNPYYILVSEIMLQQTQTTRVVEKYHAFIKRFPTPESLSEAQNSEVLKLWSGLGYNRRALYLKQTAQIIVHDYNGKIPDNPKILDTLPGVGIATASAIVTFSYNKPEIFIETNIRRVFIHFFFHDIQNVDDKQIIPLVKQAVDKENSREWYYALMDYGVFLSKIKENPNRKSKHYTKQSSFEGSVRRVRGAILKLLLKKEKIKKDELTQHIQTTDELLQKALDNLKKENVIEEINNTIQIKD